MNRIWCKTSINRGLLALVLLFVSAWGTIPAMAQGGNATGSVTLGQTCVTVPATPAFNIACLSSQNPPLRQCLAAPPTPGCTVCASLTFNSSGTINVAPGASNFEPPACQVSATISASADASGTLQITSSCGFPIEIPIPSQPAGNEFQVCLVQGL
jgi:hypothetical protein